MMENMMVYFGEGHADVVNQLLLFPDGEHDDLVDAMSLFLSYYRTYAEGVIVF
jgi:phage terminase large subunit-like protein